jgi:hypothetical protein
MEQPVANVQRYVSDELTHFLGHGKTAAEQYELLKAILHEGRLAQPSFAFDRPPELTVNYAGSICNDDMFSPQIICFCDIPVADLDIHMRKYSRFGVSFRKEFLVPRGATPVFYVAKNALAPPETRCDYFDRMLKDSEDLLAMFQRWISSSRIDEAPDLTRRLVEFRRFLDFGVFSFVKFFDDTYPEDHEENFYMEREWRLLGGVRFALDDIARIIIPRDYAKRFRSEVPNYFGQLTFVD